MIKKLKIIIIALALIGMAGCKSEKAQIPGYIRINSITLIDTNFSTSTAYKGFKTTNNITDDWVDINDDYVGTFQNPTRFPVLDLGDVQCKFTPGVKENGSAATREPYPFIRPDVMNVKLTAGQVTNVTPVYHYYANTLAWVNEFFEDSINSFQPDTGTGLAVFTITHDTAEVFSGKGSLYAHLTPTDSVFGIQTRQSFGLALDRPTWMELNFKTDMVVTVGIIENIPYQVPTPIYYVDLQPTNVWKKIYIDFTPEIEGNTLGTSFSFFITGGLPGGQQSGNVYLDNVRVLSIPD